MPAAGSPSDPADGAGPAPVSRVRRRPIVALIAWTLVAMTLVAWWSFRRVRRESAVEPSPAGRAGEWYADPVNRVPPRQEPSVGPPSLRLESVTALKTGTPGTRSVDLHLRLLEGDGRPAPAARWYMELPHVEVEEPPGCRAHVPAAVVGGQVVLGPLFTVRIERLPADATRLRRVAVRMLCAGLGPPRDEEFPLTKGERLSLEYMDATAFAAWEEEGIYCGLQARPAPDPSDGAGESRLAVIREIDIVDSTGATVECGGLVIDGGRRVSFGTPTLRPPIRLRVRIRPADTTAPRRFVLEDVGLPP